MLTPGRNWSAGSEYRFGFNGKESDIETYGEGNAYDYSFRIYNPRLGKFLSVDPLADHFPFQSTYNAFNNNPIFFIDPDGRAAKQPDEFEKNRNKISDLGGDKIDFFHQENGDTKIVDRASGSSNTIRGGESLIKGYTQRDKNTSWGTLFKEWDSGTGSENSLLSDFDNSTTGVFGSFDNPFSTYTSKARAAVVSEGKAKGPVDFNYNEINPFTAGFNGWEQFIGRANLSYYKLGDKTLFMMNDSKSMTSFAYRSLPSWNRSTFKLNGTTHQTYIWTETNIEVENKATQKSNYIHNQYQKILRESQNLTGPE
ncbi:MAG: RHS repeat-associated core domain-containing protein [Chitinophagales bacterium]|nr:hypothetical protein [Bacteroidota bacterium]